MELGKSKLVLPSRQNGTKNRLWKTRANQCRTAIVKTVMS